MLEEVTVEIVNFTWYEDLLVTSISLMGQELRFFAINMMQRREKGIISRSTIKQSDDWLIFASFILIGVGGRGWNLGTECYNRNFRPIGDELIL